MDTKCSASLRSSLLYYKMSVFPLIEKTTDISKVYLLLDKRRIFFAEIQTLGFCVTVNAVRPPPVLCLHRFLFLHIADIKNKK